MWHYVYNHQADLTLQGAVCLTGYASIYQDGVVCQYFQNTGNFHHLGVLFTIWQIHLLCYIIIMQHHSRDEFTYWQCTPCHIRLCQCVYQNDEYYVNYSKYKAWYAFLKRSVDSWRDPHHSACVSRRPCYFIVFCTWLCRDCFPIGFSNSNYSLNSWRISLKFAPCTYLCVTSWLIPNLFN